MRPRPGKTGQPWTTEEEESMLDRLREGMSVDRVAQHHERSRTAIEWRIGLFCQRQQKQKKRSLESLAAELHQDPDRLVEIMDRTITAANPVVPTSSSLSPSSSSLAADIKHMMLLLQDLQEKVSKTHKHVRKIQEELHVLSTCFGTKKKDVVLKPDSKRL